MNPTNEPQDTNNNNLAPVPQSVVPEPPSAPATDQQPDPSLDSQPVVPTPTLQPKYNAADIYPASTVEEQTPIQPVAPTSTVPSQEPVVMPASDLSQEQPANNDMATNRSKTPMLVWVFFAGILATILWGIYRIFAAAIRMKVALDDGVLSFFLGEISMPYTSITIAVFSLIVLGFVTFKLRSGKFWALIAVFTTQIVYLCMVLITITFKYEVLGFGLFEISLAGSIPIIAQVVLVAMLPFILKKHRHYFV